MINPQYRTVKKLIKKKKSIDSWFVELYSFNPYLGCEHGCMYCDGRAERYYFEGEFDKDIIVRENTLELINAELPKLREYGTIAISSGISDCYQSIEKKLELTKACLEAISTINYPLSLLTKSNLVNRDIDILKNINQKAPVVVMFTMTTINEEYRRVFEPNTSTIEERLASIKLLKENNIAVGISAMPFLPYITETKDGMFEFVDKMKELDVDFIMPAGLTLRPGRQKDLYLNVIDSRFPELSEKYRNLYSNNADSGSPKYYNSKLYEQLGNYQNELGIPGRLPLRIYRKQFNNYFSIGILIQHMITFYNYKNIDTSRLKSAYRKYYHWLKEERSYYARRRNLNFKEIDYKLDDIFKKDQLQSIIGNKKLADFLKEIFVDGVDFDYCALRIRD